jgi:hypothetical protein
VSYSTIKQLHSINNIFIFNCYTFRLYFWVIFRRYRCFWIFVTGSNNEKYKYHFENEQPIYMHKVDKIYILTYILPTLSHLDYIVLYFSWSCCLHNLTLCLYISPFEELRLRSLYSDWPRDGRLRGRSSSPSRGKIFSSPRRRYWFWGPPSLLSNGHRELFPRG